MTLICQFLKIPGQNALENDEHKDHLVLVHQSLEMRLKLPKWDPPGLMNGGLDSLNFILDLVEVGGVLRQSDVRVRGHHRYP